MSRFASLAFFLSLGACNGIWGLDEVTVEGAATSSTDAANSAASDAASTSNVGGSGGLAATTSSTAASPSGSGGDGGASTTTSGGGGEGGSSCEACGCASPYFPQGALETTSEVSMFTFQEGDCVGERIEVGGCGVLRLSNAGDYCTYSRVVSPVAIGGKCAVGRARAASSDGEANLLVELLGLAAADAVLIDHVPLGPDLIDIPIHCQLPDEFTVERAYLLATIGASGGTTFDIDLVEVDVVNCEDTELDEEPCGVD